MNTLYAFGLRGAHNSAARWAGCLLLRRDPCVHSRRRLLSFRQKLRDLTLDGADAEFGSRRLESTRPSKASWLLETLFRLLGRIHSLPAEARAALPLFLGESVLCLDHAAPTATTRRMARVADAFPRGFIVSRRCWKSRSAIEGIDCSAMACFARGARRRTPCRLSSRRKHATEGLRRKLFASPANNRRICA